MGAAGANSGSAGNWQIEIASRAACWICRPNSWHNRFSRSNTRRGIFVCGQYLAAEKIDPKTITLDVTRAADALLVLIQYQNKGYALMSF